MPRGHPKAGRCADKEYVCPLCEKPFMAPGHSHRAMCSVCVPVGWTRVSKLYRLSKPKFDAMMEAQHGRCALCPADIQSDPRNALVDHDHQTGRIRGLLCRHCNTRMGAVDDRSWLERAIAYRDSECNSTSNPGRIDS